MPTSSGVLPANIVMKKLKSCESIVKLVSS
jgi:hypothetical protein